MNTETQCKAILHYLKRGGRLTPLEALKFFGSNRLAARVFDLKQAGYPIDSQFIEVGDRKKVKQYWLGTRAA